MKKAIITGASGQDAYYLSRLLLSKGYEVYATERRSARAHPERVSVLNQDDNYHLIQGDVTDPDEMCAVVQEIQPNEFYHLAAQSHVGRSFKQPSATRIVNCGGVDNCLNAVMRFAPECRFYFAGSSEQFGGKDGIINETTQFAPRSPYANTKVYGFYQTKIYRESYGLFTCAGILFNHESPERGVEFVTRKITDAIGQIVAGKTDHVELGNLDAKRDWGHSKDYVRAMWLMLQADKPDDYVVSTGKTHSVKEFLVKAFEVSGLGDWEPYVRFNPKWMRPNEVHTLIGDSSKIRDALGWQPEHSFEDLVKEMVDNDVKNYR